jgi:hypothetical protein
VTKIRLGEWVMGGLVSLRGRDGRARWSPVMVRESTRRSRRRRVVRVSIGEHDFADVDASVQIGESLRHFVKRVGAGHEFVEFEHAGPVHLQLPRDVHAR